MALRQTLLFYLKKLFLSRNGPLYWIKFLFTSQNKRLLLFVALRGIVPRLNEDEFQDQIKLS